MKLLGLSGSLRNSRYGVGSNVLINEIKGIYSREHLFEYLNAQAQLCLSTVIEAGRREGLPFDVIYRNLKKHTGKYGLSNSEAALAAGLWAAKQRGIEIEHVSLSEYFGDRKPSEKSENELLKKVESADGILVSGPVYFGDRGSLTSDFIQLIRRNPDVAQGKIFAGITVGAKRNGGQETSLIYQMLDFVNLGMITVGNDSETTAQYGGTCHAGDVGTISKDKYGIDTSIGTGNRIANVIKLIDYSKKLRLKDKPRIGIIIVQDQNGKVHDFVKKRILDSQLANEADFRFFYLVNESVRKCIACDICPKEIGEDKVYRCIIKNKNDLFVKYHSKLIDLDALLIGGYSTQNFEKVVSIYQTFIERTRYLRRGDYVFSNCLVAPFVLKEIGSQENLEARVHTSMIRHHTIMHMPIIFLLENQKLMNYNNSFQALERFICFAKRVAAGRISYYINDPEYTSYNPVGYTLSSVKDKEIETIEKRKKVLKIRELNFRQLFIERVMKIDH